MPQTQETSRIEHPGLAAGRWQALSLMEQLGNIGSEMSRAALLRGKDDSNFKSAVFRGLELLDLTIVDPRWQGRRRELVRARELVGDAFTGGAEYGATFEELDQYFMPFAVAVRAARTQK